MNLDLIVKNSKLVKFTLYLHTIKTSLFAHVEGVYARREIFYRVLSLLSVLTVSAFSE